MPLSWFHFEFRCNYSGRLSLIPKALITKNLSNNTDVMYSRTALIQTHLFRIFPCKHVSNLKPFPSDLPFSHLLSFTGCSCYFKIFLFSPRVQNREIQLYIVMKLESKGKKKTLPSCLGRYSKVALWFVHLSQVTETFCSGLGQGTKNNTTQCPRLGHEPWALDLEVTTLTIWSLHLQITCKHSSTSKCFSSFYLLSLDGLRIPVYICYKPSLFSLINFAVSCAILEQKWCWIIITKCIILIYSLQQKSSTHRVQLYVHLLSDNILTNGWLKN